MDLCFTLQAGPINASQALKQFLPGQPADITAEDARVNGAKFLGTGCLKGGLAFGLLSASEKPRRLVGRGMTHP